MSDLNPMKQYASTIGGDELSPPPPPLPSDDHCKMPMPAQLPPPPPLPPPTNAMADLKRQLQKKRLEKKGLAVPTPDLKPPSTLYGMSSPSVKTSRTKRRKSDANSNEPLPKRRKSYRNLGKPASTAKKLVSQNMTKNGTHPRSAHNRGKQCTFVDDESGERCTGKAVGVGATGPNCKCELHGGKIYKKKPCIVEGCTTQSQSGGLCVKHGGKVCKICTVEGCTSHAKIGGLCCKHGGNRLCSHEGCTYQVVNNGVCIQHGAVRRKRKAKRVRKTCEHEGCNSQARKGGVCIRHGANK